MKKEMNRMKHFGYRFKLLSAEYPDVVKVFESVCPIGKITVAE